MAMQTIANLWWLWLSLLVTSSIYALWNQVRRMKLMAKEPALGSRMVGRLNPRGIHVEEEVPAFMDGIGFMMAAVMVSSLSMILLILSVLLNIFKY
jgi:hypothetical protein